MRLVALTEAPDHVCFRYRLKAYSAALAAAGWQLEAVPLADGAWQRLAQFRAARTADVVLLQRRLLQRWQLAYLRRQARVLLFDFDDAVFVRDSFSPKGLVSRSRLARFRATAAAADTIIAGNSYLFDHAASCVPPDRVKLSPTCVDPRQYSMAAHASAGAEARLVWIGQRSTVNYLDRARPLLAAVAERLPGLRLRVVSNVFPADCGIEVEPRVWSRETEATDLATADIGMAWMPEDDWTRGKCGLKVLQYLASGLPVIASPIGVHREMIVDGENGFLVTSPREWADRVELLAQRPELRREMGRKARRTVEERYSVANWSVQFARLVSACHEQALAKHRKAG